MELNYEFIEEMRNDIKNMHFFKKNIKLDNIEEYKIIEDFKEAYFCAFERDDYEFDDDSATWVDILEGNMANVWSRIYENDNYKELSKHLRNIKIPEIDDIEYSFDDDMVQEEIEAELLLCARSRIVMGKENIFFEKMFKAYKMGGWPCGWSGNCKNGKMMVYFAK